MQTSRQTQKQSKVIGAKAERASAGKRDLESRDVGNSGNQQAATGKKKSTVQSEIREEMHLQTAH